MEFGYITKFRGIPWNHFNQLRSSMEFHGIWQYNQIPWNSIEFHGIPIPSWEVQCNSMKLRKFHGTWSDTKFHRTLVPPNGVSPSFIEFHGIPVNSGAAKWNVTQFHGIPFQMGAISKGRHFKWHKCSMEFHGMFHGIPWNSGAAKWNIT